MVRVLKQNLNNASIFQTNGDYKTIQRIRNVHYGVTKMHKWYMYSLYIDVPLPSETIGERGAFVQRLMYVQKACFKSRVCRSALTASKAFNCTLKDLFL